jgi:glycosyltransferase involved in cell wall biosynthesis
LISEFMRIAFDLRRIKNPGIGRYMQCLTEAVLEQDTEHEFLLILPRDGQEMISDTRHRVEKLCSALPYYSVREQIELPRILRRYHIDLLHSPHFLLPLRRPCASVVTIHDVIYLACKQDLPSLTGRLYYRAMMAASARMADRIITASEFSRDAIVHWLNVAAAKIEVVHSAVSPAFQPIAEASRLDEVRHRYCIDREFILYAGAYKPRKNHAALLQAFQKLVASGVSAQLVLAGPLNEGEGKLKQLAEELKIPKEVVFTGFVVDSDLAGLYSAAHLYACPSLYEGFGFTVLEAMACGTPVLCSPATSLPEIAGDAALYSDPRNSEEFARALFRAFTDNELRTQLIEKGHENCRRFSWKQTAQRTLAVYEQVAGMPGQKAVYA